MLQNYFPFSVTVQNATQGCFQENPHLHNIIDFTKENAIHPNMKYIVFLDGELRKVVLEARHGRVHNDIVEIFT